MRKISSESSPCSREEMSEVSSIVLLVESRLLVTVSKPNQERTSCWTPSTDTAFLSHQPGDWYESLRTRGSARIHQGGIEKSAS